MDKQKVFYRIVHLKGAIDMIAKLIEQLQLQKGKFEKELEMRKAEYKELYEE